MRDLFLSNFLSIQNKDGARKDSHLISKCLVKRKHVSSLMISSLNGKELIRTKGKSRRWLSPTLSLTKNTGLNMPGKNSIPPNSRQVWLIWWKLIHSLRVSFPRLNNMQKLPVPSKKQLRMLLHKLCSEIPRHKNILSHYLFRALLILLLGLIKW